MFNFKTYSGCRKKRVRFEISYFGSIKSPSAIYLSTYKHFFLKVHIFEKVKYRVSKKKVQFKISYFGSIKFPSAIYLSTYCAYIESSGMLRQYRKHICVPTIHPTGPASY